MAEETPSADSLVTETTTATTDSGPAPFTQPNPDPAAKLDPIKAEQPVSSPHAEHGAKPKKRRRVASAVRRLKRGRAAVAHDDKVLAADSKVIAALDHQDAQRAEGKAAYASAVAHEAETADDLSEDAALLLRLADGDEFIDGVIAVDAVDIVSGAFGKTYAKDIDISAEGPPVHVSEVWLVSLAGDAVRCAVGPINGGGGQHAKIPAGHLKF